MFSHFSVLLLHQYFSLFFLILLVYCVLVPIFFLESYSLRIQPLVFSSSMASFYFAPYLPINLHVWQLRGVVLCWAGVIILMCKVAVCEVARQSIDLQWFYVCCSLRCRYPLCIVMFSICISFLFQYPESGSASALHKMLWQFCFEIDPWEKARVDIQIIERCSTSDQIGRAHV